MSCATMTAPSAASRAHLDCFHSVATLPSCDAARARAGRTGWRAPERRAVQYPWSGGSGNWRVGFDIARGLVEAGATVFITARTAADCDAAATELSAAGNCVSLPCDLSNPEEQWDAVIDVNLKAPIFLVQHLLPLLRNAASPDNPARVITLDPSPQ